MAVRAKFVVAEVTSFGYNKDARKVKLTAVTADGIPENERYHKYTPSGSIELSIDNPPASDAFVPGKQFYVDFTEAE